MTSRIDPRDLVGPPYRPCPKCGAEEYGIYHISAQGYSRRCRNCWQKGEFPLWPLSRKVLYIDQFAISNMMKALNPDHPRHAATVADPFWRTLFEKLERVVKLQLAICPDSDVHRHESMVSGHYEPLKRMYEHFSHGVSFTSTEQIAQRQLNIALLAWLSGTKPEYDFSADRVAHPGLQEWKPNYIISVSGEYPHSVIAGIRKVRDNVHSKTTELFEGELRDVPNKGFKYWFGRERKAGGRAIIQSRQLYEQRMADIAAGKVAFTFENIYSSEGLDQFNLIVEVLQARGMAREDVVPRVLAFLDSEVFKDYPASRIATLVWAVLGQAAAAGQKMSPNRGTGNDIRVLTLMPFCDAMFVDNGCRALWEKIPTQYRPTYKARLFSYNTREQFLAYLDDIERNGDPAVIRCARDVYGEPQPYLTMYRRKD